MLPYTWLSHAKDAWESWSTRQLAIVDAPDTCMSQQQLERREVLDSVHQRFDRLEATVERQYDEHRRIVVQQHVAALEAVGHGVSLQGGSAGGSGSGSGGSGGVPARSAGAAMAIDNIVSEPCAPLKSALAVGKAATIPEAMAIWADAVAATKATEAGNASEGGGAGTPTGTPPMRYTRTGNTGKAVQTQASRRERYRLIFEGVKREAELLRVGDDDADCEMDAVALKIEHYRVENKACIADVAEWMRAAKKSGHSVSVMDTIAPAMIKATREKYNKRNAERKAKREVAKSARRALLE
mmetsp:Transcript_1878/g.7534  ORF Transcript_1878/g.7534 Transcript_1878/m.7534 type:complete len:298 (-) Transcript_1878:1309-2202(-)